MKRQILVSLLILLSIQTIAAAAIRLVPQQYPTIQSAINASSNGDIVVVAKGVYSGNGNRNLDFRQGLPAGQTRAITVQSQINPENPDPDVIAATIIDCGGFPSNPFSDDGAWNRAFWFHTGEGNNSKVMGFTIRNGYARGGKGADAVTPYDGGTWKDGAGGALPFDPTPDGVPIALNGSNKTGNGYGGAILCQNGSSPTIKYCVITNCTVTGAVGGKGGDGSWGTWFHYNLDDWNIPGKTLNPDAAPEEDPDGQWGGKGGNGRGNGYGGTIACLGNSSPIISDCDISNNIARGGCGGDGGTGGTAEFTGTPPNVTYSGDESFGGDAGGSYGDGIGGAIYAENGSSPIITNCIFRNNIATTGIRAAGGQAGEGTAIPIDEGGPATDGDDGLVRSSSYDGGNGVAGGAAYFMNSTGANFTNCTFTGNKAYEAYEYYVTFFGEDISAYTIGGAIDSNGSNIVNIDTCTFTGNIGGAVYCGPGCTVNINNNYDPNRKCQFNNNSDPDDGISGIDYGSGGALYIGPNCNVTIRNCNFSGNTAKNDGGALKCRSNATIENCSFGGNRASSNNTGSGYGGGMDAYHNDATSLIVDLNACNFIGNQAIYGGGFSTKGSDVNFTNCYFIDNTAKEGGGLDISNGDLSFIGGAVKGNKATNGYGGGFMCSVSKTEIHNCIISDNSAGGIYGGNGGAIDLYGGFVTHRVKNCIFTGNTAVDVGGSISCELFALPEIQNCTFSGNSAGSYGGAIFSDWGSSPQITDCIFEGCNKHAIHEEDYGGDAIARYNLFYNNPDGEYYDSGTRLVYGPGQVGSIPGGAANLYGNPLFVTGPLSNFYLSQIPPQGSNSPAIDNGSDTAVNLGLDTFTTRTDNVGDTGQVDRGYHYPDSTGIEVFNLTASVISGSGTIEPTSGSYYAGTIVTLTATPSAGWRVKGWSGTENDATTSKTNTIIMVSNKTIGVEFDQPTTLTVAVGGGGGYYSTIQDAVSAARDGDTVFVYPGTYYGGYEPGGYYIVYIDKHITVSSLNPDDPCTVATTIIDGYRQSPYQEGWIYTGVGFGPNTDANTIFNGFTIQNCGGRAGDGRNGDRAQFRPNGEDGGNNAGSAIYIYDDGGPVIQNCWIRDNVTIGGDGGNGAAATGPPDSFNAGRGGWGGLAWGGAVYCDYASSPKFINCRIINNYARGGSGGNGGNAIFPGGVENYGGNWSIRGSPEYPVADIDPYTSNINWIVDGNLWERWGYIGDYRWYTGIGGGVFINEDSNVAFIDCIISGNAAKGGMSGQGGLGAPVPRPIEPLIPYEIPSFGGGVYCAAGSSVSFTGCTITDNISSEPNDPPVNRIDPYLGHGGGVCAEDTVMLKFTDCTFSGNDADAGGGIQFADANAVISDCNFTFNSASQGGGLFMQHGLATILRSNFTENMAVSDVNEPNSGSGGGLHLFATGVNIIDCNISSNQADTSGGGLFFNGENNSIFKNCLLTNNSAGGNGGGISSSNFSTILISNCTIVENRTTGLGYGGGLYCSYNSYTNIIDSIFWGNNTGLYGPQIAIIGVGGNPSEVDVSYSDIQGSQSYIFVDSGSTLNWGAGNIYTDPLFVIGPLGNYYLSQIAAGQPLDSPCFNSGSSSSENLGMNQYTTRTDEQPDRKTVDMGYHHPFTPEGQPCRFCELVRDGIINFKDFAVLALNWLEEDCSLANQRCQHADITLDSYVDFEDVSLFADCWLAKDTYPPAPRPSEWAIEPYPFWTPAYPNSIRMVARTATDSWDFWVGQVEYYFENVTTDHNSGWRSDPNYIESDLTLGVEYGYRVKARDGSEPSNETGWSPIRYAIAGEKPIIEDHNPPTPNPMTWATVPYATSPTSIAMVATTAIDDTAGVEYYFEDFDSPAVNSGWQSSPVWEDTTCEPETTYRYHVRARDTSAWHNTTDWSTVAEATTPEEGGGGEDTNPPVPVAWEVPPFETGSGLNAFANMTAVEATDLEGNGPVEYYFECDGASHVNSGWMTEREWNDVPIGPAGGFLFFHFRVRDSLGNTSEWSTSLPCY